MRYEVRCSESVDGDEAVTYFVWDTLADEAVGSWSHDSAEVWNQMKARNIEAVAATDPSVVIRRFEIDDESSARDDEWRAYYDQSRAGTPISFGPPALRPKTVVSWAELAAANDAEVMEDISCIKLEEFTILGQCDEIRRVQ